MDEIKQIELIEAGSDEALLLDYEDARKRYTARSAEKLAWRRDCILALLGCGLPVDVVAEKAHVSNRIVSLLGSKYAQLVAANSKTFAQTLKGAAAEALFHCKQKMKDAKYGELAVSVGIFAQRGQEAELAGAAHDPGSIEVESESPAVVEARRIAQEIESRKQIEVKT